TPHVYSVLILLCLVSPALVVPSPGAHRCLHSFPTRRSSDLLMMAAWLVFMLPYSIFAISIGTPYFTQIAEHAAAQRDDEVRGDRSEEHTSELQSRENLVCRLLLEKKKKKSKKRHHTKNQIKL